MLITMNVPTIDLDDLLFVHKSQLYTPWIILLVISIIFLIFVCYIFISNIKGNLKNNGIHTYIDLYHEIRLLNRKYKKEPIVIQVGDKLYKCRYKYTIDNKLILVADAEIKKSEDEKEDEKEDNKNEDNQ